MCSSVNIVQRDKEGMCARVLANVRIQFNNKGFDKWIGRRQALLDKGLEVINFEGALVLWIVRPNKKSMADQLPMGQNI